MASSGTRVWPFERFRERVREDTVASAEAVAFPELVWAHFLRQRELKETGSFHGDAETEYRAQLEAFVRDQGPVLNAYWCTTEASAVALTEKAEGREPAIRFHAATDWITRDAPEIGHALHTCETLAIRVGEVLRGTSQRIAMQWILSIAGYLLGVVDQAKGQPTRAVSTTACRRAQVELRKVESYYDRAGEKAARLVYFGGMMLGIGAVVALAGLAALVAGGFGSFHPHSQNTQAFFTCYGMGALGALVSVMLRMTASSGVGFSLDYEVGRRSIRRLGTFRPFIGAIFALVLYFALRGEVVQIQATAGAHKSLFFYAAFAFVAGFSERRAKIILGGAERMLGGDSTDDQRLRRPMPRPGPADAGPAT